MPSMYEPSSGQERISFLLDLGGMAFVMAPKARTDIKFRLVYELIVDCDDDDEWDAWCGPCASRNDRGGL